MRNGPIHLKYDLSCPHILLTSVTSYLQSEAVTSVPWPPMSSDLNPIEHIWDMLCRRIQARDLPVPNIRKLEAALHREQDVSDVLITS
jgi:transposase